jgi:hypothetical protein
VIAGRYRNLGELGGGGMAVVYLVIDAASGRRLALKRPRSDGSPEHQKRTAELFAREFHTLIQLAHPRIVEVYVSISALTMDLKSALSVPSLQPLIALAPALTIGDQLVRGVQARLSARLEQAREIYHRLIQQLSTSEIAGLELTHREYVRLMVMNGVAVLDAASGLAGCLDAAEQLATQISRVMHEIGDVTGLIVAED